MSDSNRSILVVGIRSRPTALCYYVNDCQVDENQRRKKNLTHANFCLAMFSLTFTSKRSFALRWWWCDHESDLSHFDGKSNLCTTFYYRR